MKLVMAIVMVAAAMTFSFSGCYSVKAVSRADRGDLGSEGSVVFSRAGQYTMWFGSHSPREYFEIVYERFSHDTAGQPVVEIGIRYRGGVSWTDWHKEMPQTVTLGAQCNFYDTPTAQAGGPVVYSTNRERLVFQLGNTYAYRAVCPVRSAVGYQLVLGE